MCVFLVVCVCIFYTYIKCVCLVKVLPTVYMRQAFYEIYSSTVCVCEVCVCVLLCVCDVCVICRACIVKAVWQVECVCVCVCVCVCIVT